MAEAVDGGASDRALAALRALQHPSGVIGEALNSTYWGVLALRQAGRPVAARHVSAISRGQARSGGFPWIRGVAPDTDDTSAAVRRSPPPACAASRSPARSRFCARAQNRDGGFELHAGRALERAVDRVGDPGVRRRGREAAARPRFATCAL